ncbi:MAG: gluconeogenesis factor YvcK family protein [Chloroflexota bacterium]
MRKLKGLVRKVIEGLKQLLIWLTPGLGIKRYFLLTVLGTTLVGVGLAMFLLQIYRTAPDNWLLPYISYLSLRFLNRPLRVLIFGGVGILFIIAGLWGMNRTLLAPFRKPGHPVAETLAGHRRRERGPRVVVIGGGHGLAMQLRGLKAHTHNLTAVVTVADDGGSSGQLRQSLGILPPGDIRNCLAALSNDEALLTQLFQYRFMDGGSLNGHSFGNLFIYALSEVTGSFEEAIAESGKVLSVYGRVLPATLHDVRLVADKVVPDVPGEIRVTGESKIPKTSGRVRRLWLEPHDPPAFPKAIRKILEADLIVVGPGSLYTSILPNLMVPDISNALRASKALKIFIVNLATQPGETDRYSCGDHVRVVKEHVGDLVFDIVVCNDTFEGTLPEGVEWVRPEVDFTENYTVYCADLADREKPWHHDSKKLARVLIDLLEERTGPLAS